MRPDAPREFDLSDDWEQVRGVARRAWRRRGTLLAFMVLSTLGAWTYTVTLTPVYRARATVLLEDPRERSPLLADYDIPTGITDPREAAALLTSRARLAGLIQDPEDGGVARPGHPEWPLHMGLSTRVVDESRDLLRSSLGRATGKLGDGFRLWARVEATGADAPREVRVRFVGPGRVVLSRVGSLPGVEWPGDGPRELELDEEGRVEYAGLRLRLVPEGTRDGRTFVVQRRTPEEALEHLAEHVRAERVPDREQVVRLIVDEADPEIAAAVANGLVASYLQEDEEAARARALDDLAYVRGQLTGRRHELESLDSDLADWRAQNPDVVDARLSAAQLVERRAGLQAEGERLASLEAGLVLVRTALEQGDRAALSRLGPGLDDPRARALWEEIRALEDDLRRTARPDSGELQRARRLRLEEKQDALTVLEARVRRLRVAYERLAQGDTTALSLLGFETGTSGPDAVEVQDEFTRRYLSELSARAVELAALEGEYQPEAELLVQRRADFERLADDLEAHLSNQLEEAETELSATLASLEHWTAVADAQPLEERASIETALEDLWSALGQALAQRLAGVRDQTASNRLALERVEERLRALPGAEEKLADLSRRRDVLDEDVRTLLRDTERAERAAAGVIAVGRPLDVAVPDPRPYRPIPLFGAVVGWFVGMLLGACVAALRAGGRSDAPSLPTVAATARRAA